MLLIDIRCKFLVAFKHHLFIFGPAIMFKRAFRDDSWCCWGGWAMLVVNKVIEEGAVGGYYLLLKEHAIVKIEINNIRIQFKDNNN